VTRCVPTEDGARIEVAVENGRLVAFTTDEELTVGDVLRLRLDAGLEFPISDSG
jgi:hypothetical protein